MIRCNIHKTNPPSLPCKKCDNYVIIVKVLILFVFYFLFTCSFEVVANNIFGARGEEKAWIQYRCLLAKQEV